MKIDVQLKMMAISLESLISGFFPHSESASSKVVPIPEEKTPSSDKPIDLSIFSSHGRMFEDLGITPADLLKAECEKGITKCPTIYGDLYVHWGARTIIPPERCPLRNSFSKT